MMLDFLRFLGGVAESDSAYCDTCYRSVVCPSACMSFVTLVHSAKAVDGMRCHLAVTVVWSQVTLSYTGTKVPNGKERSGDRNP